MKSIKSFLQFCALPATVMVASVPAVDALATNAQKSGFYVGAGAGISSFNNKQTIDLDSNLLTTTSDYGDNDFGGGGFLGYAIGFDNQMTLAVEAFINGSTAKSNSNIHSAGSFTFFDVNSSYTLDTQISTRYQYSSGVRVLPGFQINDTAAAYLILGYSNGNFKTHVTPVATLEGQVISTNFNKSFNVNGFQVGVGTGIALSDNLALRADVLYTMYSAKSLTMTDSFGDSITTKNDLSTVEGLISLMYMFN